MRKLLNTLYVTTPDIYLALDGENITIRQDNEELGRFPLHNLESVVTFGYTGASPALMGACAARNIGLCFMSANGRFLSRVVGETQGNVLLRKTQYRTSDNTAASHAIARHMIIGKLYNSRGVLRRGLRDHRMRVDVDALEDASATLQSCISMVQSSHDLEQLRGYEGTGATAYFSVLDNLILQQKEAFFFSKRSRRPPLDNVNAMLSFLYTLLANDVASALTTVGLDPYVGFLHRDRPGRVSLALDLMEELRPIIVDRMVVSMINNREIKPTDFIKRENGSVIMTDTARKQILHSWQARKRESITHSFLKEKIAWGLVPYTQAMLLARTLREDLEAYPPFLWK